MIAIFAAAFAGGVDVVHMERAVLQNRGRRGMVTVLWPRVVPFEDQGEIASTAGRIQRWVDAVVRDVAPLLPRRLAPSPQRVCPRGGCRGHAVGVLLAHHEGGCAAVGLLHEPYGRGTRLVPLAGDLELEEERIPARALPEEVLVVRDLVPCREIVGSLDEAKLVAAMRRWLQER